jgi:selenocysteine lyase/cysteine desulfurase
MTLVDEWRSTSASDAEFAAFQEAYPGYAQTGALDDLRAREYRRLDTQGHVYVDYAGGGLYGGNQLREHLDQLRTGVFGNPHSDNPTSAAATALVEEARAEVLAYFGAAPDEYTVIFTANATGALKLVGESYPFGHGGSLLLTADNHNSVNGIREFARARGAATAYAALTPFDLRVDEERLFDLLERPSDGGGRLFAYPAQSNFTGVQHPLSWISEAHDRGWDVLLDAAAFAPTNRLDLRRHRPDFVPLSFYKMFGYPTGIGCLIVRRSALARLQRPWFAGGTVVAASVGGDAHHLTAGESAFEDGTVNYLGLPAVTIGLRSLAAIGVETVHERVQCLTGWLLDSLGELRHSAGNRLVRFYGPQTTDRRGGTVAFSLVSPLGRAVDVRVIEPRAAAWNISLRTGCFCNPGAAEAAFGVAPEALASAYRATEVLPLDELVARLGMEGGGAVRVSLGAASNFADVHACVQFVRSFLDTVPDERNLPARQRC